MRGLKQLASWSTEPLNLSHLLQMRGLKQRSQSRLVTHQIVASFTDAWIETTVCVIGLTIISVASFTDAWIETLPLTSSISDFWSRIFYRCVD